MIGRYSNKMTSKVARMFATEIKTKMELTVRTPYKTFIDSFDGFSKIVGRTSEGALVIQSKQPAAAYVLLPGSLKVHLTEELKGSSGEYIHAGGFAVIHPDNSVEVSLVEAFEKKEVDLGLVGDAPQQEVPDTITGRYVEKIRSQAKKDFLRFV